MRKFVLFLLIVLMASCYKNRDGIFNILPKDVYTYTGCDSTGVVIVKGWLVLELEDSTQVTGEWEINKVGDPKGIGPQIGKGTLVGGFNEDQLWINLNPDYMDDNVFLSGSLEETEYSGTWSYSTFVGPVNWGVFKAVK